MLNGQPIIGQPLPQATITTPDTTVTVVADEFLTLDTSGGNTVNGPGGGLIYIDANLSPDYINVSDDTITEASNSRADIDASDDYINVDVYSSADVDGVDNQVTLDTQASVTLTGGGGSTVTAAASDNISVAGNGQAGNADTLSMSHGNLDVGTNARTNLYGSDDGISVADDSSLGVDGSDDGIGMSQNSDLWLAGGGNDRVTAIAGGDTVFTSGNGKTGPDYYLDLSHDTLVESANARADVTGSNNVLTAANDDSLGVNGSANNITLGANTSLWLNGSGGDAVSGGSGDTVFAAGNGQNGADYAVSMSSGALVLASNTRADIDGSGNTITTGSDDTLGVDGQNENFALGAHSTLWLNGGGNDTANVASGDTVFAAGNGASGPDYTIDMSDGAVVLTANARADVYGSNDAISAASNDTLGVNGLSDAVTLGTGSTLWLNGGGDITVTAASADTVFAAGNGQNGADYSITMSGGALVAGANARADVYGSNDVLTTGVNDTLGVNGLSDTVKLGANSTLWLNGGGGITANAESGGDTVFANGNGASGADYYLNIFGGTVILASNARADVDGANNTVSTAGSDTLGVNGLGDSVTLGSGSTLWLNGGGSDIVRAANGDTVFAAGNGKNGSDYTVYLSDGVVVEAANTHVDVVGSNDTIVAGNDDTLGVTGTGNNIASGANSSVWVYGNANVVNGVAGATGDTVNVFDNGQAGDDNHVSISNGTVVVNTGSRVEVAGSDDSVAGLASSYIGMTGVMNQVTIAINSSLWLTMNGTGPQANDGDIVSCGPGTTTFVSGDGQTGGDAKINASGGTIVAEANTHLDVTGQNYNVFAGDNDNVGVVGSGFDFNGGLNDNIWATADGEGTVTSGAGSSVQAQQDLTSAPADDFTIDLGAGGSLTATGSGGMASKGTSLREKLQAKLAEYEQDSTDSILDSTVPQSEVQVNGAGNTDSLTDSNVQVNASDSTITGDSDQAIVAAYVQGTTLSAPDSWVTLGWDAGLDVLTSGVKTTGEGDNTVQETGTDDTFSGDNSSVTVNGTNTGDTVTGTGDTTTGVASSGGGTPGGGTSGGGTYSIQGSGPSDVITYVGTYESEVEAGSNFGFDTGTLTETMSYAALNSNSLGGASPESDLSVLEAEYSGITQNSTNWSLTATSIISTYVDGIETKSVETFTFSDGGTLTQTDTIVDADEGDYSYLGTGAYASVAAALNGSGGFAGPAVTVDAAIAPGSSVIADTLPAAEPAVREVQAVVAAGDVGPLFEPARWSGDVVTWGLEPASSGAFTTSELAAISDAFSVWSMATGLNFTQAARGVEPDISFGFANLATAETGLVGLSNFNAPDGVFAPGVSVTLEDPELTPLTSSGVYSGTEATFEQVALHEIGHALGFADNASPTSIMGFDLTSENRVLSLADLMAATRL